MAEVADAGPGQAIEDLQRKQARRARWSMLGTLFVAIVVAVRVGVALFGPAELKACDATAIQTAVSDLVNEAAAKGSSTAKVGTITAIRTVSGTDAVNKCTAHLTMTDRTEGTITYHVDTRNVTIDTLG